MYYIRQHRRKKENERFVKLTGKPPSIMKKRRILKFEIRTTPTLNQIVQRVRRKSKNERITFV